LEVFVPFNQQKDMYMRSKLFVATAVALVSAGLMSGSAYAGQKHHHIRHHARVHVAHMPVVTNATRANVQAMIKARAPSYGVPTWFALRIAKIESGFNPRVTGGVGEIGVYQLKCQTARGMGYSGPCSGLYNASTNVQYGLKYLSMAVRQSHGNLKLAASKHNGGLGRKSIVPRYVAMVF
jgi:soluble lytic murein transglycosylase-like protein